MQTPANPASAGLITIAVDNTWAHAYPGIADLLDHEHEISEGSVTGPVEFFAADGQRLAAVFTPQWQLIDLRPTAEPPDPHRLLVRLRAVFGHVADYLRDHPQLAWSIPAAPEDFDAQLRKLSHACLEELVDQCGLAASGDRGHAGNWLHNALHAAGWKH